MRVYNLDGVIDLAEGDAYNEDYPTRQTELLSLSLRSVLYQWKTEDFKVVKADPEDVSDLLNEVSIAAETVEGFCEALSTPGIETLPATPELGTYIGHITTLLPALLSGGLSIGQVLLAVLPTVVEVLLTLVKREVVRLPTLPQEDVAAEVKGLKEMFIELFGRIDNLTLSDYLSMQAAHLDNLGGFQEIFGGIQTAVQNIDEWQMTLATNLAGIQASTEGIQESQDSMQRLLEEWGVAVPHGIMNTTEIDKVVWVRE